MKALVQWQDGLVSRIPTSKFTSQRSELVVGNSVRAWSKQNDVHNCRILYLHDDETVLLEKEREFVNCEVIIENHRAQDKEQRSTEQQQKVPVNKKKNCCP